MIFLVFMLNLAISSFNAWMCGNTWDASRAKGGAAHFMNWMGAIMSASGFTWCYLVILGLLGAILPVSLISDDPEATGMILDAASLQAVFDLGYLVIIGPVLGSGLAITVHSWRSLARRRRGVSDYAITGWNTVAQVHNVYTAVRDMPGVVERLSEFFHGRDSDDDGRGRLVLLVVFLAACGGALTTYAIIQARRRAVVYEDARRTLLAPEEDP